MLVIETASPIPAVSLPASLYSHRGKLAVEITSLGDDRATVIAANRPECGSFAFLVRNGVKLPATIAWGEGDRLGLRLEEPLVGDRREAAFRGADGRPVPRIAARPVMPQAGARISAACVSSIQPPPSTRSPA
ncbi:MAG TPA: hypothetical protein VGC10_05220 [Sphingomonas sp.]